MAQTEPLESSPAATGEASSPPMVLRAGRNLPTYAAELLWLREGFAKAMADSLRTLTRSRWRLKLLGASLMTRSAFIAAIEGPSGCFVLESPLGSADLMELTPPAAFALLGALLGGSGPERIVPNRPLTDLERGVLLRAAQRAAVCLDRAWPAAAPPERQGRLALPQDLVADEKIGGQTVLAVTFELTCRQAVGAIRLAFAAGSLPSGAYPGEAVRIGAPLELSVVLEETLPDGQPLADLQHGDVLVSDSPVDGEVILRVAGIPKFVGRLACCNGRRAVTILRRIE